MTDGDHQADGLRRLAACDGHLEREGQRVHFSHMFRFASTAKTVGIAELRTYLIPAVGAEEHPCPMRSQ